MTEDTPHPGPTPIELTITIKGDDYSYKQKFLEYDTLTLTENDPVIQRCIKEARTHYDGTIESVKVKATLVIE